MTEKVLLDTDIGTDIDDAVCLTYLLNQPQCELLGITTVTGEPVKRAMLASAICKHNGVEVPIYPGLDTPLLNEQWQKEVPQAEALSNWEHETDFPRGKAIEFLRETIHQHPGEITLMTIGPLTNIGVLFRLDPEIPGLLKRVYSMCGYYQGKLEWNAMGDPYATAIVYQNPASIHRSFGLDVTQKVYLDAEVVRERFQGRALEPVLDFAEVWFTKNRGLTFHDPLPAIALFDPEVCSFQRGNVEVELVSNRVKGMTHWEADLRGPHEVAFAVDVERFFEDFYSVVK
ncbi:MAG TPA: nucleoside hydrolase [Candidatus Atribacteria bacterium]|nr:nucleoside hydrolase [Candidatus Atribacteria bacterium]